MSGTPSLHLTGVNLDSPEPAQLARFYQRLLGGEIVVEDEDDVVLRTAAATAQVAFQRQPDFARPSWPAKPGEQQMMMHLEIRVDDLEAAVRHAVGAGATLAPFQPQEDVRVCLDPDGHPFCLYL